MGDGPTLGGFGNGVGRAPKKLAGFLVAPRPLDVLCVGVVVW